MPLLERSEYAQRHVAVVHPPAQPHAAAVNQRNGRLPGGVIASSWAVAAASNAAATLPQQQRLLRWGGGLAVHAAAGAPLGSVRPVLLNGTSDGHDVSAAAAAKRGPRAGRRRRFASPIAGQWGGRPWAPTAASAARCVRDVPAVLWHFTCHARSGTVWVPHGLRAGAAAGGAAGQFSPAALPRWLPERRGAPAVWSTPAAVTVRPATTGRVWLRLRRRGTGRARWVARPDWPCWPCCRGCGRPGSRWRPNGRRRHGAGVWGPWGSPAAGPAAAFEAGAAKWHWPSWAGLRWAGRANQPGWPERRQQ